MRGLCGNALFEENAQNCQDIFLNSLFKMMIRTADLKLSRLPPRSPLPFAVLPSVSLLPAAPLADYADFARSASECGDAPPPLSKHPQIESRRQENMNLSIFSSEHLVSFRVFRGQIRFKTYVLSVSDDFAPIVE
jgi:hypothetical protein